MEQKIHFSTWVGILSSVLSTYTLPKEIQLRKAKQTISLLKDHSFQKALELDRVSENKRF